MYPRTRNLQGYAFDPSLSLQIDTVDINTIVYHIPWEELKPGPIGEYIEVVDYDPTIKQMYKPVDLSGEYELVNKGLDPSESNPQFHQQMVYAVAMVTIKNFEKALGRKLFWSTRLKEGQGAYEDYVPRLRIYPHAIREANAYYSPLKKAVLFGYFSATPNDVALQMPGSLVFTCLSHDIIAHEVTHAILDGLHREYNQPTNPDVLAFHEAFADIIALFQHFTFPEVLKHQISRTSGNLDDQNLLGQLAQQIGVSIGRYGSLRNALGGYDESGQWVPQKSDPAEYQNVTEPHHRGSILVAAVFEAFLTIYKRRIQDLLRIATAGSGVMPEGELSPDLVNRLANEASKSAQHILNMCIRAIDYCPPVDITFGDFLRAIITADFDLADDDKYHYRLAFIDSFRRRGIYPSNLKNLSEESLRFPSPIDLSADTQRSIGILVEFLKDYRKELLYETERKKIFNITKTYVAGNSRVMGLHKRLKQKFRITYEFEKLTGLVFNWEKFDFGDSVVDERPSFQIQNLRLVSRVGPDGKFVNQIVFSLIQRMGVVIRSGKFVRYYDPRHEGKPIGGIEVQGGSTLIFDLDSEDVRLKYAISKPLFEPKRSDGRKTRLPSKRILSQYQFQSEVLPATISEFASYFGVGHDNSFGHMFSILHNH
ncbi:gluzincin family metallopeptidase [Gimesia aquarii]|uniref:Peptidase M4 n=1 Tax=Gimesia aquarii TaxID=2527964 RepID=A0A517W3Y7_9PLAN|nr:hypothetical protein [Gimesia aquarii]QDT99964.1 hypothetical protein V144x_54780 [Gimesia aquarii]